MGEKLLKGSYVMSTAETYFLALQFDNNLVLYERDGNDTISNSFGKHGVAVWSTRTSNSPNVGFLRLDEDGNLCLYKTDGISKVWESHTSGSRATRLTVENSGEVSLFDSTGNIIWNARKLGN